MRFTGHSSGGRKTPGSVLGVAVRPAIAFILLERAGDWEKFQKPALEFRRRAPERGNLCYGEHYGWGESHFAASRERESG